MVKKIALEEHFLCPDFIEYWNPTVVDLPAERRDKALTRLTDFGDLRLAAMDEAGIGRAVIGLAGPGVQAERDTALAIRRAHAAADELERCIRELKFAGAMINGHTNGQYLDHPALHPFWERAQALGVLIYLHPVDPISPAPV